MSSNSNLVAFIIAAGSNVGISVADKLRKNGYRVALGRRSPKPNSADDPYFHVKVDAEKRESIEAAFDTVVENLGPVNVVIYNAASLALPLDPKDFLSIPVEEYEKAVSLGVGAFAAGKKLLASLRNDPQKENPHSFIVTGNLRPFVQYIPPDRFAIGAQKALISRFIATASESYKDENIQLYYATLVSDEGTPPALDLFDRSGHVHADVYWELINNKQQGDWNHQFTFDGKTFPHA